MFALVIIFLVAFILIPLVDLTIAERFRVTVKVIVYLITFLTILYLLFLTPAAAYGR
jgi:hypothetical protein